MKPKKILILGSGALKIGEAGEFDYSGSQAIKAFKEEGIQTVLVNPNIATIQTSKFLADTVYFLAVNPHFVEGVIKKEKPDSITVSFGGQTALNCGMELYKRGILKKYNVRVLGTPIDSVVLTEDRDKFAKHLRKIHISTPPSFAAESLIDAQKYAKEIGYPVMIRAAFALGGQKSGVAYNEEELKEIVSNALSFSPQVLIEKYLHHYKEVEYEVVRDSDDNCVTVCNMENMDPLGIHTGESIVVAPSQTLNNFEYHFLREKSIEIVRSLGIVGECNVQFALNPGTIPHDQNLLRTELATAQTISSFVNSDHSESGQPIEYYVIEVNARLSRSSALASKATGYPLAYVAAKLATGKKLTEIKNQVTQVTQSCFEPALDYVVVKIPRWDLEKFKGVHEKIGSSMKSVGEVMAIGRTFEEAIQKAVRMLDIQAEGVTENNFPKKDEEFLRYLTTPTPKRLFAVAEGLKRGLTVQKIYTMTGIDQWFLYRIKSIVDAEKDVVAGPVSQQPILDNTTRMGSRFDTPANYKKSLLRLKQLGFSDKRIALVSGKKEEEVRTLRKKLNIVPSVFQIDTLAGEMPAKTNYLYMTYNGGHNDVDPINKQGVIVLGSGSYRIGSSVEFDWTCVNTALSLKKHNKKSIIINCNPETVSTDYDISDRLYFEELTFERVADIFEFEKSGGVIISVGGQTPNNLANKLHQHQIPILGTKVEDIDRAEDRNKFSQLLDDLKIEQPRWKKFTTVEEAIEFSREVGYPVLLRPSYVLSGSAMNVCFTESELQFFITRAVFVSREYPITVSKFIPSAKEIEFDAVAQNGSIQVQAISEHVEHAGVHSGDATIVYPPQRVYLETQRKIKDVARKIASTLSITGPFNIQFLAKDNKIFVIEVNLRASRTFPMVSKASGINFAEVLVDSFFNKAKTQAEPEMDFVLVKAPQFSFSRLEGADPVLRVEMSSTGEVACFGNEVLEAFLKAELSVGARVPQKGMFISLGGDENKIHFLNNVEKLKRLSIPIYATGKTADFFERNGVTAKRLFKLQDNKEPNVLSCARDGLVDLAINIPDLVLERDINDYYIIRRTLIDHNVYLLTDRRKATLFLEAITTLADRDLEVKAWGEYV